MVEMTADTPFLETATDVEETELTELMTTIAAENRGTVEQLDMFVIKFQKSHFVTTIETQIIARYNDIRKEWVLWPWKDDKTLGQGIIVTQKSSGKPMFYRVLMPKRTVRQESTGERGSLNQIINRVLIGNGTRRYTSNFHPIGTEYAYNLLYNAGTPVVDEK